MAINAFSCLLSSPGSFADNPSVPFQQTTWFIVTMFVLVLVVIAAVVVVVFAVRHHRRKQGESRKYHSEWTTTVCVSLLYVYRSLATLSRWHWLIDWLIDDWLMIDWLINWLIDMGETNSQWDPPISPLLSVPSPSLSPLSPLPSSQYDQPQCSLEGGQTMSVWVKTQWWTTRAEAADKHRKSADQQHEIPGNKLYGWLSSPYPVLSRSPLL